VNLYVVPISARQANDYVRVFHRHNQPVLACICQLAVADDNGLIHGVAIISIPTARMLDDGYTAEVLRTCTDGTQNVNSMLYGAAWKVVKSLGYRRLVTYTQCAETGSSLRAAGFVRVAFLRARPGWNGYKTSRPPGDSHYLSADRYRWEQVSTAPMPTVKVHMPDSLVPIADDLFSVADGTA
jgi:hypothetical protein